MRLREVVRSSASTFGDGRSVSACQFNQRKEEKRETRGAGTKGSSPCRPWPRGRGGEIAGRLCDGCGGLNEHSVMED
jgi:hypothetical protein